MSRWARGIERKWSPFPQATRQYGRLDRFPSPYQRSFSQIASSRLPRKGSQDRNSIDTEATEYSKSGTDDQAARQEDAAFDPSKTTPEEAKEKAGEGTGVRLLYIPYLPPFSGKDSHIVLSKAIFHEVFSYTALVVVYD